MNECLEFDVTRTHQACEFDVYLLIGRVLDSLTC